MMLGVPPKGLKPVSYRTQVPGWAVRADAGLTALPWFVEGPCPSTPGPRGHPLCQGHVGSQQAGSAPRAADRPASCPAARGLGQALPPLKEMGGGGTNRGEKE